jgi:hypothetical protein
MANAKHDQNSVPTLIAVSSSDSTTPVNVYADPTTHRLLVNNAASSGAGVPATTPSFIGQIYVDTGGPDIYMATGTTNSSDWKKIFDTP